MGKGFAAEAKRTGRKGALLHGKPPVYVGLAMPFYAACRYLHNFCSSLTICIVHILWHIILS